MHVFLVRALVGSALVGGVSIAAAGTAVAEQIDCAKAGRGYDWALANLGDVGQLRHPGLLPRLRGLLRRPDGARWLLSGPAGGASTSRPARRVRRH
jgi:hypothetical protein